MLPMPLAAGLKDTVGYLGESMAGELLFSKGTGTYETTEYERTWPYLPKLSYL
jgi:hypothetical protein